mmetsp:Transcript_120316/g.256837  ORF Transcript_120316/g.256837 Transcript_120316/m.256837 type:complete len:484 (-) Transcript_120316:1504-2955(-)
MKQDVVLSASFWKERCFSCLGIVMFLILDMSCRIGGQKGLDVFMEVRVAVATAHRRIEDRALRLPFQTGGIRLAPQAGRVCTRNSSDALLLPFKSQRFLLCNRQLPLLPSQDTSGMLIDAEHIALCQDEHELEKLGEAHDLALSGIQRAHQLKEFLLFFPADLEDGLEHLLQGIQVDLARPIDILGEQLAQLVHLLWRIAALPDKFVLAHDVTLVTLIGLPPHEQQEALEAQRAGGLRRELGQELLHLVFALDGLARLWHEVRDQAPEVSSLENTGVVDVVCLVEASELLHLVRQIARVLPHPLNLEGPVLPHEIFKERDGHELELICDRAPLRLRHDVIIRLLAHDILHAIFQFFNLHYALAAHIVLVEDLIPEHRLLRIELPHQFHKLPVIQLKAPIEVDFVDEVLYLLQGFRNPEPPQHPPQLQCVQAIVVTPGRANALLPYECLLEVLQLRCCEAFRFAEPTKERSDLLERQRILRFAF